MLSLNRMFLRADKDKSGTLTKEELEDCLMRSGVKLSPRNYEKLFKLFDTNCDGKISHEEFARTVVGEMTPRRAAVVEKAYHKIDKNGDGVIDMNDLVGTYDASKHPDVIAKKKTEKQILAQFLDMLEMHFSIIV